MQKGREAERHRGRKADKPKGRKAERQKDRVAGTGRRGARELRDGVLADLVKEPPVGGGGFYHRPVTKETVVLACTMKLR